MKKLLFSMLALLAIGPRLAAQTISVEDVEILAGNTTATIALRVHDADGMTSMHFEILDPSASFTIHSVSATPAWAAIFSKGSEGVSAISTSDNAYTGEGDVASVELSIAEGTAVGIYPISITNVRINGADVAGTSFNLTVTDRITLDETSTTPPVAASDVNVLVKRTIKANEWSTICLPFAMTEAQVKGAFGDDVQLGDFTGYEAEEDAGGDIIGINVKFQTSTSIEANRPYLIKVTAPVTEFTVDGVDVDPEDEPVNATIKRTRKAWSEMIGTYTADFTVPEQTLFLSDNKFWYSTGKTKIKGFRAYFDFFDVLSDVEGAEVKFKVFGDETGIGFTPDSSCNGEEVWYDLNGRRIPNGTSESGLYIINGSKVLVK